MPLLAQQLKQVVPRLGIFNLSMDAGGGEFEPAWSATVIGSSKATLLFGVEGVTANLGAGLGDGTEKGLSSRGGAAQGFGALQFIAHGMNATTRPSGSAAAAATAAVSDPLDQPLADNQSLVLLRLQEGMWADNRGAYINLARQNTPDILNKYFGAGGSGSGPIGRRWTHIVLCMEFQQANGITTVGEVELFGKVYEVLPLLYLAGEL